MRLVILPQALTITIPNIVNNYIALFKDTTLVFIVGIFDLLHTIEVARIDPKWAAPVTSTTGYAVAAIFYLIFCYGMSRYARAMEARLAWAPALRAAMTARRIALKPRSTRWRSRSPLTSGSAISMFSGTSASRSCAASASSCAGRRAPASRP
jgi:hypothetical protein